ncbi:Glutamine synthetase adenylyl-L-tyrosine phosphorylase / Glutamine synthetase adenylyl transferase [Gammaproteobacteria bacterium]
MDLLNPRSSLFISKLCTADPLLLSNLESSGDLFRPYDIEEYSHKVQAELSGVSNEANLMVVLRRIRRREMLRIAWRDLVGTADYVTTVAELSFLAEAILDATLRLLESWIHRELGVPYSPVGIPQSMTVLALGKLGAKELNFSSDIDLLFVYPEEGETQGRRVFSNSEFFIRLGQRLIKMLTMVTPLGFVFRVDMRLRPFGEAGPIASSFDSLEGYYQAHGREWERYALIRARPVAGDLEAGYALLKILRPFVYRRYLDYGSFEALREMKARITAEVRRKGLEDNVKLGLGGIREAEFIVQGFQLTRGGRTSELQDPRMLPVLEKLGTLGFLPASVVRELSSSYIFLRTVEHRLQEYDDQQTQTLPKDEQGQIRLASWMEYASWETFRSDLEQHFVRIHSHFEQIFADPQIGAKPEENELHTLWHGLLEPDRMDAVLSKWNLLPSVVEVLTKLKTCPPVRALSNVGRERLDRLMPLLLATASKSSKPTVAIERLVTVLESIGRRTTYISLLIENPLALSHLVQLCSASPWITQRIARFPLLLDDLIDPRTLYAPPRRHTLVDTMRQAMARLPEEDLESQMEAWHNVKHSSVLRVAAADITGALPEGAVSLHLSELAEVMLQFVLDSAWRTLVQKHGYPTGTNDDHKGFSVIAYGKLGGIELGYGSDLDLVFLHTGEVSARTDGPHPIETGVFFMRLAQRMVHLLTTRTPSGKLYEIDLRLRPSGSSGLLVTTLDAYRHYQCSEAWTWEQQALVRARPIAGDTIIGEAFQEIRRDVLCRERDPEVLRRDVQEMREKMRASLASKNPSFCFDLKQDRGGIADIEFLVQYAVLRHAFFFPEIIQWTDNLRQIEALESHGLIPEASLLKTCYHRLRRAVHHAALQEESTRLLKWDQEVEDCRCRVSQLWKIRAP